MLLQEFPNHYTSIDAARTMVRSYRGILLGSVKTERITPMFKVPESYEHIPENFDLPTGIKKVLVLQDIHFPYHNAESLTSALEYGYKHSVDAIYLNGDILDIYQLSDHEKDPRKRSLSEELEMGREFLQDLRTNFDGLPIYYIPGNHELRMERYLYKNPQLLGVPDFQLDVLLRLGSFGVNWLPHGSVVNFGKLLVEHGDKLRGAGGVNPARTLLLKFKRPVICGHFHRTSQANAVIYQDEMMSAWSAGCLCELEPKYMPVNEWNHGFSIINMLGEGNYHVENKMIVAGKVF